MGEGVSRCEVDVDGVLKSRLGDLFQRAIALTGCARVVDQNIQTAPCLSERFHDTRKGCLVCDITGKGMRFST